MAINMNVDGSAKEQSKATTASGIVRNSLREWLCGFTYRVGIASSVLDHRRIEIEGDILAAI